LNLRPPATLAVVLAIAVGAAAQEGRDTGLGAQLKRAVPGTQSAATVQTVSERAGYLEGWVVSGEEGQLRYLFPDTPTCRRLLQPEASLKWADQGTYGELSDAAGDHCDPIGTLTLQDWRRFRRNARSGAGLATRPRAQANYQVIHLDEEFAFLRGRFPLTGAVGVVGGYDIVAVVRNAPECEKVLGRKTSSMEYLERAPYLVLISNGRCPIRGLAMPPPPRREDG
jgi:hypothetical protein